MSITQRSKRLHTVMFASLVLCLVTSQFAVTQHSIDHFFHDSSVYCATLASLDNAEAKPLESSLAAWAINSPQFHSHSTRRVLAAQYHFYFSRAPPLTTHV